MNIGRGISVSGRCGFDVETDCDDDLSWLRLHSEGCLDVNFDQGDGFSVGSSVVKNKRHLVDSVSECCTSLEDGESYDCHLSKPKMQVTERKGIIIICLRRNHENRNLWNLPRRDHRSFK